MLLPLTFWSDLYNDPERPESAADPEVAVSPTQKET